MARLERELADSKRLSEVLSLIAEKTGIQDPPNFGSDLTFRADGTWRDSINLPDNVLVYEEDILGGKVIKQEGNKCIVVKKDGSVKAGITKLNPDEGYSYRMVREESWKGTGCLNSDDSHENDDKYQSQ